MPTSITPLRITLGGGGSDLITGEGICFSATINKTITVSVSSTFDPVYVLHYSQSETVETVDQIQHRLLRAILERFNFPPGIQISTIGEIPAGTGLGSSGAFTAGVIRALFPTATRTQLIQWACELDIGQQDQWSAIHGGLNIYDFAEGVIRPVHTTLTAADFSLYYTGVKHDAAEILTGPSKPFTYAREEVAKSVTAFENNDLNKLGLVFIDQWIHKFETNPSETHGRINDMILKGVEHGAFGGKLIGAGHGGFILFAGDAGDIGLTRVPFAFTDIGTRCV